MEAPNLWRPAANGSYGSNRRVVTDYMHNISQCTLFKLVTCRQIILQCSIMHHMPYASNASYMHHTVCTICIMHHIIQIFCLKYTSETSGRPTNQPTDIATYRAAIATKNDQWLTLCIYLDSMVHMVVIKMFKVRHVIYFCSVRGPFLSYRKV